MNDRLTTGDTSRIDAYIDAYAEVSPKAAAR